MAYKIQRKQKVFEEMELTDELGNVAHTLKVAIDVEEATPRIVKARNALEKLQRTQGSDISGTGLEAYGNAVVTYLEAIFGVENTKVLLEFYEGKYTEMLIDVSPFITDVIYKRINEIENAKLQQLKQLRRKFRK